MGNAGSQAGRITQQNPHSLRKLSNRFKKCGILLNMNKPNWKDNWEDSFIRIRDQMKAERAAGMKPRRGMKNYSDSLIDSYARKEATRRIEESINRWNEKVAG